jgi:hypothetical protein
MLNLSTDVTTSASAATNAPLAQSSPSPIPIANALTNPLISLTINQEEKRRSLKPDSTGMPALIQTLKIKNSQLMVGKAYDSNDCFFDAVAQALLAVKSIPQQTVKSLRMVCHQHVNDPKNETFKHWFPGVDGAKEYAEYKAQVQYTQSELADSSKMAVWGDVARDGQILCKTFNIRLHAIHVDEAGNVTHQLITPTMIDSIKASEANYDAPDVIHVACYRRHFVPLVSTPIYQQLYEGISKANASLSTTQTAPMTAAVAIAQEYPAPTKLNSDTPSTTSVPFVQPSPLSATASASTSATQPGTTVTVAPQARQSGVLAVQSHADQKYSVQSPSSTYLSLMDKQNAKEFAALFAEALIQIMPQQFAKPPAPAVNSAITLKEFANKIMDFAIKDGIRGVLKPVCDNGTMDLAKRELFIVCLCNKLKATPIELGVLSKKESLMLEMWLCLTVRIFLYQKNTGVPNFFKPAWHISSYIHKDELQMLNNRFTTLLDLVLEMLKIILPPRNSYAISMSSEKKQVLKLFYKTTERLTPRNCYRLEISTQESNARLEPNSYALIKGAKEAKDTKDSKESEESSWKLLYINTQGEQIKMSICGWRELEAILKGKTPHQLTSFDFMNKVQVIINDRLQQMWFYSTLNYLGSNIQDFLYKHENLSSERLEFFVNAQPYQDGLLAVPPSAATPMDDKNAVLDPLRRPSDSVSYLPSSLQRN